MPAERKAADPLGFGLVGSWIELEARSADNAAEFAELERHARLHPALGALAQDRKALVGPMIVRDRRSRAPIGFVKDELVASGAASVAVYVDLNRARRGYGLEAATLFISQVFDSGARLVVAEVLDFNREMNAILQRAGFQPQSRLREHVFAAGRFHDLLVYAFSASEWERAVAPYRKNLPGGRRPPSSLGRRERPATP